MINAEIVAPGGNLEKLKTAVLFGADTVYFGGEMFNLRDKSQNFTLPQIAEAVDFCKSHGVKTTFLLNAFVHEGDIRDVTEYVKSIEHFDFDSVMISDPATLEIVQESALDSRIYLSTQVSTLNHVSARFWQRQGVSRVVLARETTLDEIKKIRDNCDVELEIFAHGAVCISYSGRCLLSRYLSGRDANQGACSHPCRWNFALVEEKRPGFNLEVIEHERNTQILSSKDLCLIDHMKAYVDAGVNAFKLEGRMKSLYYAANVTRIYKHALDCIKSGEDPQNYHEFYHQELDLVSHRPYTDDLFNEFDDMENRELPYINHAAFVGMVSEADSSATALIKPFNPIRLGDEMDIIYPLTDGQVLDTRVKILSIFDTVKDQEDVLARSHTPCRITFDRKVFANGILRKKA